MCTHLSFLQLHVALMKERKKLTAVDIYDLFVPCYSPEGSNAKEEELEVMFHWMTFLEECEGRSSIYID